jgi:uncharacterized membrane protein
MKNIKAYFAILGTLLVLDGIWLGFVARDFYLINLEPVMRDRVIMWPLVLFYFFYCFGILQLAVKNLDKKTWTNAFKEGAILGFVAYMTFDLVNYGLVAGWPLPVVFPDIIWGAVLTGTASYFGFLAYRSR